MAKGTYIILVYSFFRFKSLCASTKNKSIQNSESKKMSNSDLELEIALKEVLDKVN